MEVLNVYILMEQKSITYSQIEGYKKISTIFLIWQPS